VRSRLIMDSQSAWPVRSAASVMTWGRTWAYLEVILQGEAQRPGAELPRGYSRSSR
jgi:hypothetical protein